MAKDDERKTCWVLTRCINEYDQDGEYFEAVWLQKPTIKQLVEFFKGKGDKGYLDPMSALDFILHIERGGGRQKTEDAWYFLKQVKFGERNG